MAGIRHTMDLMVGSYLGRRRKQRYCDKSLGTAGYAELLARVYPQARFICLYRHPMDVIASGLEACPWGLGGYGFDPYIAATPGNAVLALARFWASNAAEVLGVEERFPGFCHRVRYEDLVADPERATAQVFSFIGASPAQGISTACFSGERERFGPADYKIWRTSEITADSVGRGWSVPASMILPSVLAEVNELAGKLGYVPVDDAWGTSAPPRDLRIPGAGADTSDVGTAHQAGTRLEVLGERLRAGLASVPANLTRRWGSHETESFVAVTVRDRPGAETEYWLVDLKAGTVTPASQKAQDKSDWDIIGSAETWEKIIGHDLNLNVALRSCRLRYCDETNAGPVATSTRLDILSCLLGIAIW